MKKVFVILLALAMMLSIGTLAAGAEENAVFDRLIAQYTFDDEDVKDSVSINHGIFYNNKAVTTPTFADGVSGRALQLSTKGKGDRFWLSIPMDVFAGSEDTFTLSMWYKATGYNTIGEDSELFSFYNTSIENFMFYSPAAAAFQDKAFNMKWSGLNQGYGYANIISPYNPDQWVHLVYVVEAVDGMSKITAYINGAAVEVDQGGDWDNSTMTAMGYDNFTIGGKNPYKGGDTPMCLFYGLVDEICIYSGALTSEEAAAVYASYDYEATDAPVVVPSAPTNPEETEPEETGPKENKPEETNPQATEPADSTEPAPANTGLIIGVAIAVVVVAAIVIVVVKGKKK